MNNTKKHKDSQDMLLLLFALSCFNDSIILYKLAQLDNNGVHYKWIIVSNNCY